MSARLAAIAAALVALATVSACSNDERPAASASSSSGAVATGAAIAAEPSPGCGATTAAAPGETKATLMSGGVERTYFLRVPVTHHTGQDAAAPTPLVLDFHGYLEGADLHRRTS